jgi:PHD/YefM family antitoxin component YafN of YafNO toxin-antitoxin module
MRTELVTTLKCRAAEILSERENEKAPILITPVRQAGRLPG